MSARRRIEAGFGAWGRLVVRWRWLAITACFGLTAVLVARLPELRVDNSDEAFLLPDDPERIRYDHFKEQFGREDRVLVLLRPTEIFDLAFLELLRDIHREIEREVPYVEEVTSLVNARNTRGEADELIVEDLMADWPESEADLRALRARVLANPLYVNVLISADTRYTVISIKPFTWSTLGSGSDDLGGFEETGGSEASSERLPTLTDVEGYELVDALMAVLARHESADIEMHLMGGPSIDYRMTQVMQRDVTVLLALSLLLETVLLYLIFRRITAVVLPMVVVVLAMLSTMGLMVWLDIPFSLTLNMLPAFLLVVGLCDSIHLLAIAYRRMAAGDTREEAIIAALAHSGLAVVMTSVTTAAGLVSFVFAELAAIVQLGVLAPAGVMLAMLYSLVLLPALFAVAPRPAAARSASLSVSMSGAVDRWLARAGDAATRHPWRSVAVTGGVLLAALPGFLRVGFSHDGIRWFPESDPMRIAFDTLDREFEGTSSLEIVVDTGRENGVYEPELLARIERAMRHGETLRVGDRKASKAISIVDLLKETHQALNENRPELYTLPETRQLVAQELLLFEGSGSDDLEELTDAQFQTARVTLRTPWADALAYPPFVAVAREDLRQILGEGVRFELTGGAVLFTKIFEGVIYSMARSYTFALLVITVIMVVLIGHLGRGLVAMVPNLIPIYLVLALMGWTGIPLDAGTLLIGGVIIGLAVDDTIHFMHKFSRYYEDSGDSRQAVHETLRTTGSALLFTSVVLASGFGVFLASYMNNTFWIGLLVSTGTIVAFLADVLLGPALMVLVTRRTERARG